MEGAQTLADIEPALRIATALVIGLVVGIERAYAFSGLLCGVCGAGSDAQQNAFLVGFGFRACAFVFAAFRLRDATQSFDNTPQLTGDICITANLMRLAADICQLTEAPGRRAPAS
jgi:hypothetical protein